MGFEVLTFLKVYFLFFLLTANINDHCNTNEKENRDKGNEFILPACLEYEGMSHPKTKRFNSCVLLM